MTGWPTGVGRRVLAEIDSTMTEGARIAPQLDGPEWVLALSQSDARGRRGRPWVMPKGNFAASLVLYPKEPPAEVALRSFVAALALREAFVAASGQEKAFSLKWPNDVLLNGGKVAGILLESHGVGSRVNHLVIGIGVNLAAAPDMDAVEEGAVRPVSLKTTLGVSIMPEAFLDLLAPAYARYEAQFLTQGFAPIREAWLAHAARLGEVITARTGKSETTGTFRDVDGQGNLVLETSDSRKSIAAAEIFF